MADIAIVILIRMPQDLDSDITLVHTEGELRVVLEKCTQVQNQCDTPIVGRQTGDETLVPTQFT